jgi:hypothetical protein
MTPKERNCIKGSSQTQGWTLERPIPLEKKPSTTQQRRKGGSID